MKIGTQKMKLLHISYDYPDAFNPNKTSAVKDLLTATAGGMQNDCASLNRVSQKSREISGGDGGIRYAAVFGLPMGLNFRSFLKRSCRAVEGMGFDISSYDLLFAHKMTFEGPVAHSLSRKYRVPFALGVMQTDIRVLRARPDLRSRYKKIIRDSAGMVVAVHWLRGALRDVLGREFFDSHVLPRLHFSPYIVRQNRYLFKEEDNGRFACVVSMRKDYYKVKNMKRTILAFQKAGELAGKPFPLDIYGDGPEMKLVEENIRALGMGDSIKLPGRVPNEKILDVLSGYRAFLLCSFPETFGMVYIEALRAGIPIIFSRGTAVDGFFEDYGCQIKAGHRSVDSITQSILDMDAQWKGKKAGVRRLQESGALDAFLEESAAGHYAAVLTGIARSAHGIV